MVTDLATGGGVIDRRHERRRRWGADVLSWLVPVLVVVGLACHWVGSTASDPGRFADRTTRLLDSQPVRARIASEITDLLIRNGDSSAANFRPAYLLAIESFVRTDTFRTLFHDALYQAHRDVLFSNGSGSGLDLSGVMTLLSANLQLQASESATASTNQQAALQGTFPGLMSSIADTGVVELASRIDWAGWGALALALVLGAVVVLLQPDRRRGLVRIGFVLAMSGLALAVTLAAGTHFVVGQITTDDDLRTSISDGVQHVATELSVQAAWLVAIGAILVLAARTAGETHALPRWAVVRGRLEPYRQRLGTGTRARVLVAAALVVVALWGATHTRTVETMLASAAMMVTLYCGLAMLASLWPRLTPQPNVARRLVWGGVRLATGFAVLVGVLGGTIGLSWKAAEQRSVSIDAPEGACNGSVENCALRLDQVVFPGSHNAMSSALSGEWLFPEHNSSILGQLRAGIRALLVDTHYGVPTSVRIPGYRNPIVATDRTSEQTLPGAEAADPAAAAKARELAAQVTRRGASPGVYLCHNYCELGSTPFADALHDVKRFLDANPGEVVMLILQDAVEPARTVAAIEQAELADRVATLVPGQPLPTLGELVAAKHQLIVFAESVGTGGPAWYHHMYDGWFGETKFGFRSIDAFTCDPNRGTVDAPLLLVNHWVDSSPPNQGVAAKVNSDAVLTQRLEACATARHRMPNVVAVDFEDRGDLFKVLEREAPTLRQLATGG